MSKIVYVGPTIIGVATRNTTYDGIPEALQAAIQTAPFFRDLCVPVSDLADAMAQIRTRSGAIYTMYKKALTFSAN